MAGWHHSDTMEGGEIIGLVFSLRKPFPSLYTSWPELGSCSLVDERNSVWYIAELSNQHQW